MLRLAHISDVHITTSLLGWTREDWFNKRLSAWANLRLLGRGYRFRHAEQVLAQLVREVRDRGVDHVIFSGDATALGFDSEIRQAARILEINVVPGIAVPGNHDYCTAPAANAGHFEQHFASWQKGERVSEHVYPFAQRVGHVWLVAVNSATGNRWMWDAAGRVGPEQLERLGRLLAKLDSGPRIIVTHFPVCLANGKKEHRTHGLRDVEQVVTTAAAGGVSLWLHGHRHNPYYFQRPPPAPFAVICCGSSTQTGIASYGEYVIEGNQLHATRRAFDPVRECFQDAETFSLVIDKA